jgi:hypothetical protein
VIGINGIPEMEGQGNEGMKYHGKRAENFEWVVKYIKPWRRRELSMLE